MITKEMIERINQLSRKSKQDGLSEEEKLEQQGLRKKYVEYIKSQVRQQLDSIEFVEDEQVCEHEDHECDCGCDCKKTRNL